MGKERPAIITLTTDFGQKDYFVGSLKGVILGINPLVHLVDISHEVQPYRLEEAAYLIKSAHPCFSEGSVHMVVVDPGVGGHRRPILVEGDGSYFVGPDNGVFSYIYSEVKKLRVIHLTRQDYFFKPGWQPEVGPTFHGRDIFAPVAAWLSKGIEPAKFGEEVQDPVRLPLAEPRLIGKGMLEGKVIYVDRFGNLITNLTRSHLMKLNKDPKAFEIKFKEREIDLKGHYAEGGQEKPCAVLNSCGHLEIFMYQGNARIALSASVGDPVLLIKTGESHGG